MGGQQLEYLETETSLHIDDVIISTQSEELSNLVLTDPLADFLVKHGDKLTEDHEGNTLPYNEAVYVCPALAQLIRSLGEGALALTASRKSIEEIQEVEATQEIIDLKPSGEEVEVGTKHSAERDRDNTEFMNDVDIQSREFSLEQTATETTPAELEDDDLPQVKLVGPTPVISDNKPRIGSSSLSYEATEVLEHRLENKLQETLRKKIVTSVKSIPETISRSSTIRPTDTKDTSRIEGTYDSGKFIQGIRPDIELSVSAHSAQASIKLKSKEALITTLDRPNKSSPTLDLDFEQDRERHDDYSEVVLEVETHTPSSKISETLAIKTVDEMSFDQDKTEEVFDIPLESEWAENQEVKVYLTDSENSEITILNETPRFAKNDAAFELPAPIEEVELVVIQLVEKIEELEPHAILTVHEILDAIIVKAESIQKITETPGDNDASEVLLTEETIEEDLKELIANLFNQLEMEYTPELIESFTKLALKNDISSILSTFETEGSQEKLRDKGTHEAITRLLSSITNVKKSAQYACRIGSSTLRLYNQQFSTV